MDLPTNDNLNWIKLLSGEKTVKLKFLATKILLTRLQKEYKKDSSLGPELITELKNFLNKNENIANVKEDIKEMFS